MKKKGTIILLLVVVVVIAGYALFSRKTPDAAAARPHYRVTAAELIKEFTRDGAIADKKYTGKILRVSGTVTLVSDGGSVVLGNQGSGAAVVVGMDQRHAGDVHKIQVGDEAVIQGVYSGYEAGGENPEDLLESLGATIQLRSGGMIMKP